MFRLSYDSPCEIQGTIVMEKYPQRLGRHTDVNGVEWDIHGIFGHDFVQACPYSALAPALTSTATDSINWGYSQSWQPYKIAIQSKAL